MLMEWPHRVHASSPGVSAGMPLSSRVGGQDGDIFCGRCMEKGYGFGILATGQYQPQTRKWLKLKLGQGGSEYQAGLGWSITRSDPRGPQPLSSLYFEAGLCNEHARHSVLFIK